MKPIKEKFESKYTKGETGCWEWAASKDHRGYGQFYRGKNPERAHRISWEIYVGPIPKGLFVLHKCDNRGCVNPDHLFLGTHTDNMRDCAKKGRFPKRGNRRILNEEQVAQIRAMRSSGVRGVDLAKMFGVAHQTITNIVHNYRWK